MSKALSGQRSGVSGAGSRRADLRAIEQLGIKRLATDSRRVRNGDTFMAYPGEAQDGRRFIPQAIANGARSVLWERRGFRWKPAWRVDNLGVAHLRARAGHIAGHVYGHPSARLWMVGVTGTNGKTTCSQWIARALDSSGTRSAVIGTLGYGRAAPGAKLRPLANTTPDAVWLQEQLAAFLRAGAKAVSMEVSSIGLDQDRVEGIDFDVALFTNLTRDHLDYHGDMRRYKAAKARLFESGSLAHAVVNLDDEFGRRLADRIKRPGLNVIGYGFGPRTGASGCSTVAGRDLVADARGVRFHVATPWGCARVASPVLGSFNASNLLGTLAVLLASGVSLRKAVAGLARLAPIAGRMQTVGGGMRPLIVVDYAHTPDALEQVLLTLRELMRAGAYRPQPGRGAAGKARPRLHAKKPDARLTCVFGCGGERDRGKRPLMGSVAARLSDRIIVTSDNPRGEDPRAIADDIVAGIGRGCELELDRRRAIRGAVGQARGGDVVLIAGKGHENYQEVNGVRRPFSDMALARSVLARWTAGRAP